MQFLSKLVTKKIVKLNLYRKEVVTSFLLVLPIISYIIFPMTANAGLFSIFSDLTSEKVLARSTYSSSSLNSQNMLLLEAAVNSDPTPHKSSNNNILAYDNAFSAEIGPTGTASEIDNRKISSEIQLYTVQSGDTLSSIANMFDVTKNTIIWENELSKNSSLKEGQILVILPTSGIKYTVKSGDTIKSIVFRFKADLNDMLQYNDLTLSSSLSVGDTIIIPDVAPIFTSKKTLTLLKFSNKAYDTEGPFYPGYYIRPIFGGVKSQGLHGYNAVDLAAPIGTIIRAAAAGTVIASKSNNAWNGTYGNYVIISHPNGTQTLYAHNLKNFVSIGDKVEQGEMIAKIGMTGNTTGPHVHFEIRGAKNPF